MGRKPAHKWDAEKARRIEQLAMIGCNDDQIAAIENIPERSMLRYYRKELTEGRAKGTGAIAKTLYQMALSGKNPAATFFYLKCRARWQEVQRIEHSAPDGKPLFENHSDEQLDARLAILVAKVK